MHSDSGRIDHYRDFYRPPATSADATAPLWLVWGNCQAEALRRVLDAVPGRPYRTVRIPPVHELCGDDMPYVDALLARTSVLLTQPVRTHYRGLPIGVNDLLGRLPRGATVIRWPVIRYAGLYPFQVIARHPRDRSITPPGVPYHDLRTVAAARDRRSPDDPWDIEVSADQLRAVAAASRCELARRERLDTDVAVSDVLAQHGAQAAHTINHPGNPVLHDLAQRLLDCSDTHATPALLREPLLDSISAPLDGRVIDALSLEAAPRARWRQAGLELEPQHIHAVQLAWYRRNPDFIEVTMRRHHDTMRTLGMLDGAA